MKKIILMILIFTISMFAQESKVKLTGSLSQDLKISGQNNQLDDDINVSLAVKKRSPLLAIGLSAVLPGAGQFYNKDYWKSAIFATLEVAAIVTAVIYDKKGDDQTASYQSFANSENGWSVNRYAHWSVKHAHRINPTIPENSSVLDGLFINENQENEKVVWSKLHELEAAIGKYYSHQLAPYDDQQYYEMIGKYEQFASGWKDFYSPDYPYTDTFDYYSDDPITATFLWYADERGKANSFYDISNLAVKILVANHVISAVEAALSANRYNKRLSADVKMQSNSIGYNRIFYPELNLSYRF